MEVEFQDLLDNISDLGQNFNVTTIDVGNTMRQANRAFEFVQRRLGLPSDKKVYSFNYYEDTEYYTCPTGFNELLRLYYNTNSGIDKNYEGNRWNIVKDIDILYSTAGYQRQNRVASTSLNGSNQLLLKGRNVIGSQPINSFDSLNGLTFSTDVLGQGIDTYVYQQGSGSLKFNIASGLSSTKVSFTGNWDVTQALLYGGMYRLYIDFPVGTSGYFSNVEVQLLSSTGNYFDMTTTTQSSGSAWTENTFNQVSFSLSTATTTGSPVATNITTINIIFNHSGSFAPVTNLRIDNFYLITPDLLDCIFYSAYKGTDSTGMTPKIWLTDASDILSFGSYAPDLIGPIALKAALGLWPQLRSSEIFWQMYKADFTDTMQVFSRSYPRARTSSGTNSTKLQRP